MAINTTKVTSQVRLTQIIAGIQQFFSSVPEIVLGGVSITPAALVAQLQKVLAAIQTSSNSKAAWLANVQTERNELDAIGPTLRYIKAFVITQFGDTQDAGQKLQVFGYTPRKARSTNVEVKAEAAVKGRATRVARGTKGKKQKAKITGSTVEPSVGSDVALPAPAATTAPAVIKPAG